MKQSSLLQSILTCMVSYFKHEDKQDENTQQSDISSQYDRALQGKQVNI